MKLTIDLDEINDPLKKEWLLGSLKSMQIKYRFSEKPQTIAQYNKDLEMGEAEIENGEFITAEDLKNEMKHWH